MGETAIKPVSSAATKITALQMIIALRRWWTGPALSTMITQLAPSDIVIPIAS